MRRDGIVFNHLRHEHVATNRTIHNCGCGIGREKFAYIVESRDKQAQKKASKAAATFLLTTLHEKGGATDLTLSPSDVKTFGLYNVESITDMNATHLAFVEDRLSHSNAAIRDAAARIVSAFKQFKDERDAMRALGFKAHRHRDSLTKKERLRVEELATSSCNYNLLGCRHCWYQTVETKTQVVPHLERIFRRCETGWYAEPNCNKGKVKTRRWFTPADDETSVDDEDDDVTDDSDDGDEGDAHTCGVSLFDFVDAAATQPKSYIDNHDADEYDFCGIESLIES
ncbi:Aste57867_13165 [Aphanomyces stellatus]|uniref:Aste57867_13165 protein n=1 Tax=Aphanomyces stellatus TaxID=120398 RepID=A0A485KY41_9STRA|nr:hypothetical protein As57867_013116 [Aphanomyces stellatus]VFT90006.1 Aste57867_13165 [Aphanomyces stellatus]